MKNDVILDFSDNLKGLFNVLTIAQGLRADLRQEVRIDMAGYGEKNRNLVL
ncbi:MAG: hypothetical protein NTW16_19995 [Bacteroidetes bacterium]|nr:hypothetical protein [Bacteroidota bacterium]